MTSSSEPVRMTAAKTLALAGFAAMAVALLFGFTRGDGWAEVAALVRYPWFNVSLVDVYVGFALFSAWVVFRERHLHVAVGWIVLIAALGNLVCCLYAVITPHRSRGDWVRLWMGARAPERPASTA